MPLVSSSYPGPPFYLFNGHLETLYPSMKRQLPEITYRRERIDTADGDFLDLDWLDASSSDLVILSHGLEGNSQRAYMRGMAGFFLEKNWNVCAWHCRSCSEEMNNTAKLYYHGGTEDFDVVVQHIRQQGKFKRIVLVGFSMGGNINLKYLGITPKLAPEILGAVAISAPCDLASSAATLNKWVNRPFYNRFFKRLEAKIRSKAAQFPGIVDVQKFEAVKRWEDFDEFFSAPLNGFPDLESFYYAGSSKNFFKGISLPTLLLNAQNDPILAKPSFPEDLCESHPSLFLETPKRGGHVGFMLSRTGWTWAEHRTWKFVQTKMV